MKTVLIFVIFSIATITSFAQVKTISFDHLKFKGVPIDGTLKEFVSKMKKVGFTHINTEDGIALLKGDFAAYKDCSLGVSTLKNKDIVSEILVVFPEHDTWSSLSGNYFYLKELLTEERALYKSGRKRKRKAAAPRKR